MDKTQQRTCELCKGPYTKSKSESVERFGFRLYCSLACSRKAQRLNRRRYGYRCAMPNSTTTQVTQDP